MKKLPYLLVFPTVLLLLSTPASATERTLIIGQVEHGGFGGPVVKFTQINQKFGVLVGGRGGWIINHTFVIGGGGYGLVNQVNADVPDTTISFGYGGGELEYIVRSDDVLHFTLQTLIGAGAVDLMEKDFVSSQSDHRADAVFVGELNANLELNVTPWFRLNFGAGYRLVSGVNTPGLSNSDLGGPTGALTLKFGKF